MPSIKIRKGDTVIVRSGRDKGKTGEVLGILPKKNRALVQGINKVRKHQKSDAKNPDGGIIERELPIHISNIAVLDKKTGKPSRVGFLVDEKTGKKQRIMRRSNEVM